MPSRTGRCPRWCAVTIPRTRTGPRSITPARRCSLPSPGWATPPSRDRLDVQAAQHLPDDPAEPGRPPSRSRCTPGRYRLIGLTPPQARESARVLARRPTCSPLSPRDRARSRTSQPSAVPRVSLPGGTPDPRRPLRVPSLDRSQRTAVRAGIGALRGDHLAKRGDQALRQPGAGAADEPPIEPAVRQPHADGGLLARPPDCSASDRTAASSAPATSAAASVASVPQSFAALRILAATVRWSGRITQIPPLDLR